jgi:uncharacterized membrane protein YfcA
MKIALAEIRNRLALKRKPATALFYIVTSFCGGVRMSDWLFLCGILSGVTTWLFGFGGGFVTVPLLYFLVTGAWGAQSVVGQQAMHIAVATSALVMLCSALLASWRHARTGTLRWRRLWAMLTGIAVGGTAGALLALEASGAWIRWLFVIYLLATIADCYLRAGFMTRHPAG